MTHLRRSPAPQRWKNRCYQPLPTDALIGLKVRGRLGRFIPIWLNVGTLHTIAHLRIARVPQRRPACWCDARWLCLHPYVVQYVADVGAVREEGDDSHLPATEGARQWEHLLDAGDQHRPQAVRRALGWHRLGLGWEWIACLKYHSPTPVLSGSARTCAVCAAASCASATAAALCGEFAATDAAPRGRRPSRRG
jgi:hypothetical protein